MTAGQEDTVRQKCRAGIRDSSDSQHVPEQRTWMTATSVALSEATGLDIVRRPYWPSVLSSSLHRTCKNYIPASLYQRYFDLCPLNKSWLLYGLSHMAEIKLICQQMGDPNDLFPKNIKVSYCGFTLTRKEKGNHSFSYFFIVTSVDLSLTFS